MPGFEIFFDLQLPGNEVTKEQTDPPAKAEQCKEDESSGTELEIGAALACLLLDPSINLESLGDDFIVSTIGDQSGVDPSGGILDASNAPYLIW